MPSFSLYPLKRMTSMDSPLAKGSSSTSPRSSDEEKASPLPASNGEGGVEEEEEPRDILDMRDHDEMIKGTIKTMEKTHTEPKNIFGLKVTRGPLRVIIQDEVRFGLWALLAALLVAGIIFLIVVATTDDVHFSDSTTNPHGTALIISGIFTIVSCFIAAVQIYMHLTHWSHPASQKLVIRIIFMVPVYSVAAWLALWQLEYSTYIDFVRVCYEAFTLYTFMVLLTQYLGGHAGVVEWMQYKEPIPWIAPFWCFPKCAPTSNFLWYLKYSCLQYAICAPVAMFIGVICESQGAYGDGELNYNQGYLWVTLIINCSQLTSLYALAWLYMIMKKELTPFSPVFKFLVIKSVVFFTFWQGVGLAVLVKIGAITDSDNFSVGQVQVGLQDFIITIEMFIAACCHKYAFGYETYSDGSMALLMEQRATFIAQLAYKRAVDAARKELEERERAEGRGLKSVDGHEHSYEQNGAASSSHSIEMETKEPAKVRDMTQQEKDALVSSRAKEIIEESASNEEVLFDNKAMRASLPTNAAEYRRERRDRSEEKESVDEEMVRESNGQAERSRSGNREMSTSDGGKGGILQDEEES